jgi:DNA-binding IclR family transcriptional regulator
MGEVGVLDKVMAILHAFTSGSTTLQPPEVAERLGISQPTAYRLMKNMAGHGLLEYDAGGYRLGVVLLHLGARVADALDLNNLARPQLRWLRDETSENAELHLLHGTTRVPVEVVVSPQNLRPMGQVGVPFPVHVGASAKVLLAWLPEEERRSLSLASHRAEADARPFDIDAWEQELAATRERGWAESDGERESGVSAIAAPIRNHTGTVVAAMVVSGPSSRLTNRATREAARGATVAAAARTSAAIGQNEETTTRSVG